MCSSFTHPYAGSTELGFYIQQQQTLHIHNCTAITFAQESKLTPAYYQEPSNQK